MQSFPNRCQHIKVNGTQCGCPALRRNKLCFFHKRHHDERIQLNTDRARHRSPTIELPVLEDANSIQVSLMQIMRMIIAGQIDGKAAGLLLYALQTASSNLRRTTFDPSINDVVLDPKRVGETQLSSHVWEDSDFRDVMELEYDEETMRLEALERGRIRAKQKAELERMSEAEADRIIEEGRRQRQEQKQSAQRRAERLAKLPPPTPPDPTPGFAGMPTEADWDPINATRPPNADMNTSMNEVRKRVRAQIMQALPAIRAANPDRQNGGSSG